MFKSRRNFQQFYFCFMAVLFRSAHARHFLSLVVIKGSPISKAFLDLNLPVQTKTEILSRKSILLVILLYDKLINLTRIYLHPTYSFEYSAACLSVILVTTWFDSVCVTATRWVNFREHFYMNMNYSYSTTMYESMFAHIYITRVEKDFFAIFA